MAAEFSVSVVIPVYNRREFAVRAIDSVRAQTFPPLEIIVVDDGSNDGTTELLANKKGIILHRQNHSGVSAARNSGIKISRGNWLAFLDSDDEWLPDKLEKQVAFHREHPEILLSQPEDRWIRNGNPIKQIPKYKKPRGRVFSGLLAACVISPSGVMLHESVLHKTGLFDEEFPVCEDYDLWLRIARHFEMGLVEDELVIKHGGHADQLSTKHPGMDMFRIRALEKHLDEHEFRKDVLREIIEKSGIVANGAKKRNNQAVYAEYREKLELYSSMLSQS